ncbi:MAG TPA: magnesium/cobalt transporter CorA [Candidatus Eisenbacteria bacterium]|jgi:magnesium transporter
MIRAWIATGETVRPAEPGEAVAAAAGGASAWIDLDCEDEATARRVLEPLAIHPLVLEDMVMEINRPKVDNYGSYLYLVVHSARWDDDRPQLREIDVVLGERFLVTYHDGSTRSVAAAHEVLPRRPELLAQGPAPLLHFVLDVLVDHYLPIVDHIAEEVDQLEEQLFEHAETDVHRRVVRLKRGMSALRRIVGPQRDTVLALTRDEFRPIPAEMRPFLRDVYDRLARVSDLLDSFRDETASLLELHVSMISNRLNEVIRRLTVIATVGLPLTVITGYYGMNFALPEYRWHWGEWYALGLLLLAAAGTWWFLRRQRLD